MIKTEHLKSNQYDFKCKAKNNKIICNKFIFTNELKSSINSNAYCY